ncbi:MAG: polyprenol monophosphomannose synthase [bacterium]|nr:polyprenol monophosphomannose synthase [bacterium]
MIQESLPHPVSVSQQYCLVVIPTYNEALNILPLIDAVLAQSDKLDVLVVDDNSPDGTGDLVEALSRENPRVRVLRRAGKMGLGTAYLAGFQVALQHNYAFVCQMDADFSHQPRYLPGLLAAAETFADVAIGSRNIHGGKVENWSLVRQLISRGGSLYAKLILGLPIHDVTGGFKCFRAGVLRQLDLAAVGSNGYAFQVEMNFRCHQAGFTLLELPITFPDRVAGQSKMSSRIVKEAAIMVLRLRVKAWFSPRPPARIAAPAPSSVHHS